MVDQFENWIQKNISLMYYNNVIIVKEIEGIEATINRFTAIIYILLGFETQKINKKRKFSPNESKASINGKGFNGG